MACTTLRITQLVIPFDTHLRLADMCRTTRTQLATILEMLDASHPFGSDLQILLAICTPENVIHGTAKSGEHKKSIAAWAS